MASVFSLSQLPYYSFHNTNQDVYPHSSQDNLNVRETNLIKVMFKFYVSNLASSTLGIKHLWWKKQPQIALIGSSGSEPKSF